MMDETTMNRDEKLWRVAEHRVYKVIWISVNELVHEEQIRQIRDASAKLVVLDTGINGLYTAKRTPPSQLTEGLYLMLYGRCGEVLKINHFSARTQEGSDEASMIAATPTDLKEATGAKSMTELERLNARIEMTDPRNGNAGEWGYIHRGRWCIGSGADAVTFYRMDPVDQDDLHQEVEAEYEQLVAVAEYEAEYKDLVGHVRSAVTGLRVSSLKRVLALVEQLATEEANNA